MATGRRTPALDTVDVAPPGPRRRRPRWQYLLFVLAVLVLLLAASLIVLQQPPVATRFANAVLARFHPVPRATIGVAVVRGDWVTHLELHGIRVTRGDTLLASIDTLRAHGLGALLAAKIHVRELHLSGVFVSADIVDTTRSMPKRRNPLTLADLLRGRFYTGPAIRVDRLSLTNATYAGRGGSRDSAVILDHIDLRARNVRLGRGFSFEVDSLALGRAPHGDGQGIDFRIAAKLDRGRFEARSLRFRSDSSSVDGDVVLGLDEKDALTEARLRVRAQPLSLRDLEALAPGLDLEGAVVADIDVTGPSARQMSGRISASCERGRWGPLALEGIRLDATFTDGGAETKLSGVCGQARVVAMGSSRPFDPTPTYDLVARTDRLPDRIPGAAWWADLARRVPAAVTMRLRGSGYGRPVLDFTGRVTGAAGDIEVDGHLDLTRDFTWSLRRLAFDRVDVARWSGDTTASSVSGTLSASGRSTFARSRSIDARLEVATSQYGAWKVDQGRAHVRLTGADMAARFGIDSEFDLEGSHGPATPPSRLQGRLGGNIHGFGLLMSSSRPRALRDGRAGAKLRIDLDPSRVAGQEISDGSLGLTLARGRVNVDAAAESPAGKIDLSGHGRPFDPAPSFVLDRGRFQDLDLAAWTGNSALSSRIAGSLTGEGRFAASSQSSGTWEGALELRRSQVGRLEVESGRARASWSGGEGNFVAVLHALGDTLAARSRMTIRDGAPRGRLDLAVPFGLLAAFAGHDSLNAAGSLSAEATFSGINPSTADVDGTVRARGNVGELRVDSLLAGVRLRRGTLFLDTLLTRSNVGSARGAGQVAMFDTSAAATSSLNITILMSNASPLRRLIKADTVAVDTARVDLSLRGSGGRRVLDAKGSARLIAWNKLRLRSAEGSVQADLDSRWRPARAHAEGSLQRLRGAGVPLMAAAARVDFDGSEARIDLRASRDETHEVRLVAQASADSVGQHVSLETVNASAGSAAWALSRPARIDYGRGRLQIDDLDVRSSSGRVHARGVIDRHGNQDFKLDMNGVGLDLVSALLGRSDLNGAMDGSLAIEGPAAAPRGTGSLDVRLVAGGQPAGVVRSRLMWDGRRLDFGGHFASPEADSLTWTGSLPLALSLATGDSGAPARVQVVEGDLDVRLLAREFPLRALSPLIDPKTIGPLEGTLDMDARLRGSSRSIAGDGRIEVKGGAVPVPVLGVVYRDIDALATLAGDRIAVRHARATSKKGRIEATGDLRLVTLTRIEPRIHVESRRFVVADATDLRAILTGSWDITGTFTSPVVKGKAILESSSFTMKPAGTAESDPTIQLTDADVRMLEETFGDFAASPKNAGVLLYDASDLDLDIKLEGNNWIRQNARPKLSIALTGDVHMKKAPHREPELFGRIAPIPNRGYVEQFARSFDITGGEIFLNGSMKSHRVDIQAQYKPSTDTSSDETEVTIKLDVQGNVDKMSLVLSSDPAMSEAEIVSYIATGHSPTVDRMSGGSSSNDKSSSLATDIGLSQITGFAEESAREAVGLDVLQVRFDALKGATLVAGRYLDPQLYVGFRQPLQYKDTTSPSAGETNRTSVEVEYAVQQWLVLNLQGETSKLRSFIRARHAY